MKKTLFFLSIILLLSNCKKNNKQERIESKLNNKTIIKSDRNNIEVNKNRKIDSLKEQDKIKRKKRIDSINKINSLKILSIAYVIDKNGVEYRNEPSIQAEKLGYFDFGTKLAVVEKTDILVDTNDSIKGKWIKVKSEINRSSNNWLSKNNYPHIGFIVSSSAQDSSKINFTELPVLANSINFPMPKLKEKPLNLSFIKIDSLEFNKYMKIELSKRKLRNNDTESIKPYKTIGNPQKGGYFLLKTNNALLKFVCGKNYSRPCYVYEGFNKPLNAYSIGRFGEGIYESFLLDKDNNSVLYPNCEYDNGNYGLQISPTNKNMLVYSSIDFDTFREYYNHRSYIGVYNIEEIKNLSDITEYYQYNSEKWEIINLYWINDNSFVLKVFDKTKLNENGQKIPIDTKYLKAVINK